jgi:hypothetical protein
MDDDLPLTASPDETVDVVVLRQHDGQTVPIEGKRPVALYELADPTGDLLEELLDSTVRLSAAEGVSGEVLAALLQIPVPPAFSESPWLRESHPVILIDGESQVSNIHLVYSQTLGLRVTEERPKEVEH